MSTKPQPKPYAYSCKDVFERTYLEHIICMVAGRDRADLHPGSDHLTQIAFLTSEDGARVGELWDAAQGRLMGHLYNATIEMFERVSQTTSALPSARCETSAFALLADIRRACRDHGRRMQPELVSYISQAFAILEEIASGKLASRHCHDLAREALRWTGKENSSEKGKASHDLAGTGGSGSQPGRHEPELAGTGTEPA